jgi:hypothetical protein
MSSKAKSILWDSPFNYPSRLLTELNSYWCSDLTTERTREFAMTLRQSPDQRLWSAKYPAPDKTRIYRCKNLSPALTIMNTDRFLWWRIYICDRSWVFFAWALKPGESTCGHLGRDWTPPSCNRVSFRLVLGRAYTQPPGLTSSSQ